MRRILGYLFSKTTDCEIIKTNSKFKMPVVTEFLIHLLSENATQTISSYGILLQQGKLSHQNEPSTLYKDIINNTVIKFPHREIY